MKVERTNIRETRGAGSYEKPLTPAPLSAPAGVLGIPGAEFTPPVREAIVTLMGEIDSLRGELQLTRGRLAEVEKSADQDHLLPLLNRRAFVRELTRYISVTGRYGTPTSLVYFDLDGFKSVNDTYGHPAGDAVLAHFAQILLANVRDSDAVGRLGGDEFGILLSHATQEQAHKKADFLAERLRVLPANWAGAVIAVGLSYGAFELKPGDTADTAMARADEAMYAHKRASR